MLLGLGAALPGCDDGAAAPACALDRLDRQPRARFPLGETAWLPTPLGACAGRTWAVVTRPDGSAAAVVAGADGVPRLTPDTVGAWRLALEGASDTYDLTVVARPADGFENFGWYPSSSVAAVAGELWTANAWDGTLSRIAPADGAIAGRVAVGSWPVAIAWRDGLDVAVVAQRGSDTLGFVDVATRRLVDAVWVGDEPANVVLSEDGATAYVALATEDAIAVVDVAARAVRTRVPVVKDPLAMALVGDTLWVASLRSGQADRAPFGADALDDERDLAAIDLGTLTLATPSVRYLNDVGHTITALAAGPDAQSLYVADTRGDTYADLVSPPAGRAAFTHEVMIVDAATGAVRGRADLGRQASAAGPVVGLRDLAIFEGRLLVTSEGTDEVLALDPTTLAEVARYAAPGRPRDLAVVDGTAYAHGAQGWSLTALAASGAPRVLATGSETRPAALAAGQRFFTGAGRSYGKDWSCNTCHVDNGTDTLVWKAGPFDSRHSPRPLFWLEATMPLGWDGYSASARNFAHTGPVNIGVKPTSAEATALAAYLESLVPPPAANGRARRDGAMSDEALLGEPVFADAGCTVCHGGTLATSRTLQDEGITAGTSDVPSLVGAYRHVAWLKHGEARTLEGAVAAAVDVFAEAPLDAAELAHLTRYVAEIGPRDLAVLTSDPARGERSAAVDRPIRVVFTAPVLATAENLARVSLRDADGRVVPAAVAASGRAVTLTPAAPLAFAARYSVTVEAGLEAVDERTASAATLAFDTARAPTLALEGAYRWVVDVPFPDFANGRFDNSRTVAVTTPVVATRGAANASLTFDFGDGLTYEALAVIDGDVLRTPGVPVPAGTALGDSRGLEATLVDLDADGVADELSGALELTGPGFDVTGVTWKLIRPPTTSGCTEGPGGDVAVTVTIDASGRPVVSWPAEAGNALAVYVTDPGATLPLLPGQTVTDGAAYWAVATTAFPAGFAGPVTYGEPPAAAEDASVANGAPAGGAALEAGRCYQLSVTTNQFATGWVVLRYPSAPAR